MNRASRPASCERCCTQSGASAPSASDAARIASSRRCHCSAPLTIPASRDSESHREVEIPPYSSCSASGSFASVRKSITDWRERSESNSASSASVWRPSGRSASGEPSCKYTGIPASTNTASASGRYASPCR